MGLEKGGLQLFPGLQKSVEMSFAELLSHKTGDDKFININLREIDELLEKSKAFWNRLSKEI